MSDELVACCGLDCGACDMRQAAGNPAMQREFAQWFRDNLGRDVAPSDIGCTWCRGEREGHWSADCWILQCCVDRHGRAHCSECPEFPCEKLEEWAGQNARYAAALERLRAMHRPTT